MLTFNGMQYAQTKAEFESINAHGYYRVNRGRGRVSVSFMTPGKEPIALISPDSAVVTAFRASDGIRYMYGCTRDTEKFLAIEGMKCSDLFNMARAVIRSLEQTGVQA